jgi:hypothetical protein
VDVACETASRSLFPFVDGPLTCVLGMSFQLPSDKCNGCACVLQVQFANGFPKVDIHKYPTSADINTIVSKYVESRGGGVQSTDRVGV